MPRRSGFTRTSGARRLTNWGLGPGGTAAAALASSSAQILGGSIQFADAGTVVRIRGQFDAFLNSSTSAGDGFQGAVGIGIATLAAFTAGIGSLPTPITEAAWDGWMWHQFFGIHEGGPDEGQSNTGEYHVAIDSKAMRKVSDEIVIYAAIEVVEIGTGVMQAHFDSRMLLKEG